MENTRKKNGKTSTDMFRHMRSVQSYPAHCFNRLSSDWYWYWYLVHACVYKVKKAHTHTRAC